MVATGRVYTKSLKPLINKGFARRYKNFGLAFGLIFKKIQKNKYILLIYEYMFGIMYMDTFENIRCFPFLEKERWWLIMTKRELSQFIIILLLFFVVITLLFK